MKNVLFFSICFVSLSGYAREIYTTRFPFTFDYANVETGTQILFKDELEVRVSDDGSQCLAVYKSLNLKCSLHDFENNGPGNIASQTEFTFKLSVDNECLKKWGLEILNQGGQTQLLPSWQQSSVNPLYYDSSLISNNRVEYGGIRGGFESYTEHEGSGPNSGCFNLIFEGKNTGFKLF
jgi:hypothetical protein